MNSLVEAAPQTAGFLAARTLKRFGVETRSADWGLLDYYKRGNGIVLGTDERKRSIQGYYGAFAGLTLADLVEDGKIEFEDLIDLPNFVKLPKNFADDDTYDREAVKRLKSLGATPARILKSVKNYYDQQNESHKWRLMLDNA